MPGPSETRLHRSERVLGWLVALMLAVAATTSCTRIQDKSTEELIALVQSGEYSSVTGSGEACDAAYNLGLRKATEAVDELIAALSGPAADCMALALGQIGDLRAVEPLVRTLGEIRGPSLAHPYDEDKMEFDDADEALVAIGAPAVESLLTIAASGDENTRDLVTYVLGRIRDSRAEPYLLGRLKAPNPTTLISRGKLEADALVRIFGDQTDRLLPLLQSKETVAIAYGLVGLGQTGTAAALSEALMQFGDLDLASFYLDAGNPDLRTAALDWAYANGYELKFKIGISGGSADPPSWGAMGADGS